MVNRNSLLTLFFCFVRSLVAACSQGDIGRVRRLLDEVKWKTFCAQELHCGIPSYSARYVLCIVDVIFGNFLFMMKDLKISGQSLCARDDRGRRIPPEPCL